MMRKDLVDKKHNKAKGHISMYFISYFQ